MADRSPQTSRVEPPTTGDSLRFGLAALRLVWSTSRSLTTAAALLTLVVALLPALATYLSKLIVDGVLAAIASGLAADRTTVLLWVATEALVMTALIAGRRLLRLAKSLLHAEIGYSVSCTILDKALTLELEQLEDPAIQQSILLARQQAASRPYGLVNRIFELGQYALTLLSLMLLLWTFSPWAVVIVLIAGLPLFFGELRFSGRVFRFYTGRTPEMRERAYLESLMTGDSTAAERLHFGTGAEVRRRYSLLFRDLYGRDRRLQTARTLAGVGLGVISSVLFFAIKAWIVWTTLLGAITLGSMTMFVGLVKQGQGAVTSLLASLGGMYEDLLYVSNLYRYLDTPRIERGGEANTGPRPDDGLRLECVSFTYPGSEQPAVADVSLHLRPGTRLGLVGANGSGKSTLVKLLVGLYRPDKGRVLLDGLDLESWNLDALRARIGVMFQPFVRYKMTVGDNIAVGDGLAGDDPDRLLAAADRGLAGDLVRSLPAGLATRLSRRFLDGRELSGGQWQRLALARALLRDDADILILDEPTSAMDAEAEAAFIEAAGAASHERTTVLVSHRLANLRLADRIVLLDAGRLVEAGSHDELMAAGGTYATLFSTQAGPYRNP
jgi:ABC-type multidrug transport system fused ATPase/permease subunit